MASPARPYRFPALPPGDEHQQAARCTCRSCGTCGASALASCVALCCCPCAAVGCLTLALVKAPYVAGRRCLVRLGRSRPRVRVRKARRVRDVDDDDDGGRPRRGEQVVKAAAAAAALPRRRLSGELGDDELARAAGQGRASVMSSVSDPSDKVWIEMYEVGLWGFGRLSLSPPATTTLGGDDSGKDDGDGASPPCP